MNILQFWLLDSIVKFKATFVDLDARPEDQEPLANEQIDDEDDLGRPGVGQSSVDTEWQSSTRFSTSSNRSFTRLQPKENEDAASSVPTSASSRTIVPRRRSPPPSPSQVVTPRSSYGSIGDDSILRTSRERWRSAQDDEDEHTKWSKGLGAESDELSRSFADTSLPRSKSPSSHKQWESWHMPTMPSPEKHASLR